MLKLDQDSSLWLDHDNYYMDLNRPTIYQRIRRSFSTKKLKHFFSPKLKLLHQQDFTTPFSYISWHIQIDFAFHYKELSIFDILNLCFFAIHYKKLRCRKLKFETKDLNLFILRDFAIGLLLVLAGFLLTYLNACSITTWLLNFLRPLVVAVDEVKDELHGP